METQTHTLETREVDLAYDVRGPLPTAGGRPPLLMLGHRNSNPAAGLKVRFNFGGGTWTEISSALKPATGTSY